MRWSVRQHQVSLYVPQRFVASHYPLSLQDESSITQAKSSDKLYQADVCIPEPEQGARTSKAGIGSVDQGRSNKSAIDPWDQD